MDHAQNLPPEPAKNYGVPHREIQFDTLPNPGWRQAKPS